MIIGNNNNYNNKSHNFGKNALNNNTQNDTSNNNYSQSFDKKFNFLKEQAKTNQNKINPFATDKSFQQYSDVTSTNSMADKSFSMLQERLSKGLISLEEFNKKCKQINKMRKQ